MSGLLAHSPADIIRWALVEAVLGTDPADDDAWPVYASNQPDSPDNCITVFDTLGYSGGLSTPIRERQEHHGFSIMVRSKTHPIGYVKARQLAVAMDDTIPQTSVTVDGQTYCIYAVTRTTDVASIGVDNPDTKRSLFTINCVAHIRQHS